MKDMSVLVSLCMCLFLLLIIFVVTYHISCCHHYMTSKLNDKLSYLCHCFAFQKNFQMLKEEFRKMTPPTGLENIPLSSNLTNCKSPVASFRESQAMEKERESGTGEKDKDVRGATGMQAGGPVRTRIRKTSRANLFTGSKTHGLHSVAVTKANSNSSNGSLTTADSITSTTGKTPQLSLPPQESSAAVAAAASLGAVGVGTAAGLGDFHPVIPEVSPGALAAAKPIPCTPETDGKAVGGVGDDVMDGDVCNHINHTTSSSVTDSPPDSGGGGAEGTPC